MRKRILASTLSAAMVLSLAACGGNPGTTTTTAANQPTSGGAVTETTTAAGKETSKYQTTYGSKQFDDVTITVELFDRSNAPAGSTITDNKWTKYAQEEMKKVGINLQFTAVPRSDEVTKMQTMMSSGTAPTVLGTYTFSYAQQYLDQGGIWDLSEFIDGEDQAKNLKAYIGEDCMNLNRTTDGVLYGVTARRATTAMNNIMIRKDWLDDLGVKVPTTVDELYDCLDAMVNKNPDGQTNVVGATFLGFESTSTGFGYRSTMSLAFSKDAGDAKKCAVNEGFEFYTDEGYRDYLRYLNKIYNAGLMDQEFYASTDEIMNANLVNGQLGFLERNVNYNVDALRGSLLQTLQEKDSDAEFISIKALKNVNDGKCYTPAYGEGGMVLFMPLTASAEQVEAAVTYLDWMATKDGGFVLYHGNEGENFKYNDDGTPIVIDSKFNATDKDWIRTDLFLIGNQGYFATVDEFNACTAAELPGYEDYVIDNYELSLEGEVINSAQNIAAPQSQVDMQSDLNLLRSEYQVKIITCAADEVDSIYDQWLQAAKDLGVEQVLTDREAAYNAVN